MKHKKTNFEEQQVAVFPKHVIYQQIGYRRVMVRCVPERQPAAIFQSSPIFEKGQIRVGFLVMGLDLEPLAYSESLTEIMQKLFLTQSRLRKNTVLSSSPKLSA